MNRSGDGASATSQDRRRPQHLFEQPRRPRPVPRRLSISPCSCERRMRCSAACRVFQDRSTHEPEDPASFFLDLHPPSRARSPHADARIARAAPVAQRLPGIRGARRAGSRDGRRHLRGRRGRLPGWRTLRPRPGHRGARQALGAGQHPVLHPRRFRTPLPGRFGLRRRGAQRPRRPGGRVGRCARRRRGHPVVGMQRRRRRCGGRLHSGPRQADPRRRRRLHRCHRLGDARRRLEPRVLGRERVGRGARRRLRLPRNAWMARRGHRWNGGRSSSQRHRHGPSILRRHRHRIPGCGANHRAT